MIKHATYGEYLQLIETIAHHDFLYFVEASPEISDYEYDLLLKKLEEIEAKHPDWVTPTSPSQRVGPAKQQGFIQVAHKIPMLSLANTYSKEELVDFFSRVKKNLGIDQVAFCAELKMDGIAISILYEKGLFVQALTRGDGKVGDDVTANVKTIRTLPLQLKGKDLPERLIIRAEVFMPKKSFAIANQKKEEEGEQRWANPRNAAAGTLKLLNPQEVRRRNLAILCYGIAEDSSMTLSHQHELYPFFREKGLPTFPKEMTCRTEKVEDILAFADKIEKKRHELEFEIDGIVIKVDAFAWQEELGTISKSPRFAVAYKFAPEQAISKVKEIVIQVGRTGVLTPVAELEPVLLAGSIIARATLHNEDEVARKDIREGDTVIIEKGGDVIPKVASVLVEKRTGKETVWKMPTECPVCHAPVHRKETEVAVRCLNPICGEKRIRRLVFFVSRDAMNIDHLGQKVVEQLVEKGLVKEISDFFALTKEDLFLLEGFKEKSVENLYQSLQKAKKTTLPRLILALGIEHVGEKVAEDLAREAETLERLMKMDKEALLEIEGIGEKVASSILAYFSDPLHQKEIERMFSLGIEIMEEKREKDHFFTGKVIVLTGSLEKFTRSDAERIIKTLGGRIGNSVTKQTDLLICGDEAGSKYKKAKELGIPIFSEEEFTKLL